MERFDLIRVACATPIVHVANPQSNAQVAMELLREAAEQCCDIVVFPELSLTGYTCGDLFHQEKLLAGALDALRQLKTATSTHPQMIVLVGLPINVNGRLFNCAAVLNGGRIVGFVPKSYLPNYREFYEQRWFAAASVSQFPSCIDNDGDWIPFGTELLFRAGAGSQLLFGVELCEDLWVPIPPSCKQALAGANLLINLSAGNEAIAKYEYRRHLVVGQSARCIAGYVYAAAGVTESTTDLVFGGHSIIAENGRLLRENVRFQRTSSLTIADVDLGRLVADRMRMNTFCQADGAQTRSEFIVTDVDLAQERKSTDLLRPVLAKPFVPSDPDKLRDRCEEIFQIQMAGLAKRLEVARPSSLQIGVSGGLDSTLALLVLVKTCDLLGWDRNKIHGITMPGFGTTARTRGNADRLMKLLRIANYEIDIRQLCFDAFKAQGHQPFGVDCNGLTLDQFARKLANLSADKRSDLTFENTQARIRTMLLMNRGFVIGTGDLSELALGWCTYNADHMSMYNPNISIPKTLVKFLVQWAADHEFEGETRDVLLSIVETQISPELLPPGPNEETQSTESVIGPYELHDFFLYHFLRYGFSPRKILFLARHAKFDGTYPQEQITSWLKVFLKRFFTNQYKRSCLPDGPKVGTITLSPRGDWRMPSDAEFTLWIADLEEGPEHA